MKFNEILRILRRKKNLSQKDLGNKLGLAESTIGMYEQGKRQPDYETLLKIADYFEVTVDYLLSNKNSALTNDPISDDPDLQIAFKEASDFSEEARKQTIDFINYIKEKEKKSGRTFKKNKDRNK